MIVTTRLRAEFVMTSPRARRGIRNEISVFVQIVRLYGENNANLPSGIGEELRVAPSPTEPVQIRRDYVLTSRIILRAARVASPYAGDTSTALSNYNATEFCNTLVSPQQITKLREATRRDATNVNRDVSRRSPCAAHFRASLLPRRRDASYANGPHPEADTRDVASTRYRELRERYSSRTLFASAASAKSIPNPKRRSLRRYVDGITRPRRALITDTRRCVRLFSSSRPSLRPPSPPPSSRIRVQHLSTTKYAITRRSASLPPLPPSTPLFDLSLYLLITRLCRVFLLSCRVRVAPFSTLIYDSPSRVTLMRLY